MSSVLIQSMFGFLADGPAEVTRATRESLRMGATQIKFMAGGGVASLYERRTFNLVAGIEPMAIIDGQVRKRILFGNVGPACGLQRVPGIRAGVFESGKCRLVDQTHRAKAHVYEF